MTEIIGSGLAFPLAGRPPRRDRAGARRAGHRAGDPAHPRHGAGRTADAPRVRLRRARLRVRLDRREHDRQHGAGDPRRAAALGTADRGPDASASTASDAPNGLLTIDIIYKVRATNTSRNLVYPFYVIPAEENGVRLPEIQLDDRRFQDLVSEARTRIARSCPEWTEHNVSDPGITLIELFAWMTEMTIYRLNRVPDKLHVALLDLLGHPARRPDAPPPPACASGWPTRRASRSSSPAARPRSARRAPRTTSRSSSRSTRTSRSRR